MAALEKLERLHDLAPGEARDVEDQWPLTPRALRAGVADETPVFERLHAQTEVAP
jgi:hypothetical protein